MSTQELKTDFSPELTVKGVTEADRKFVKEHIEPTADSSLKKVRNNFTRQEAETTPLLANLVHFVLDVYEGYLMHSGWKGVSQLKRYGISEGKGQQCFDRARMLILKLDRNIYYDFID
jgi:hypothetical protein